MSTFALIYIFFHKYIIPFAFVIGFLYFLYGVIEYFIIEGQEHHGKELFLKSITWFIISLLLFGVVALIGWLGTLSITPPSGSIDFGRSDAGVNVERREDILQVPNAPGY